MVNRANRRGFYQDGAGGATRLSHNSGNRGFSPFPAPGLTTITENTTLTTQQCGVTVLSGTTAALTATMPTAASVPGAKYIFRAADAMAHVFTGSQETGGVKVFRWITVADADNSLAKNEGSKFLLPGSEGDSVIMESDGKYFLITGGSGSLSEA